MTIAYSPVGFVVERDGLFNFEVRFNWKYRSIWIESFWTRSGAEKCASRLVKWLDDYKHIEEKHDSQVLA